MRVFTSVPWPSGLPMVAVATAAAMLGTFGTAKADPQFADEPSSLCTFDQERSWVVLYAQGVFNYDSQPGNAICEYQSKPGEFGPPDVDFAVVRASGNDGSGIDDRTLAMLCFKDRFSVVGGMICGAPKAIYSSTPGDLELFPDGADNPNTSAPWTQEDLILIFIRVGEERAGKAPGVRSVVLHRQ